MARHSNKCNEKRGILNRRNVLLHYNARPNTVKQTQDLLSFGLKQLDNLLSFGSKQLDNLFSQNKDLLTFGLKQLDNISSQNKDLSFGLEQLDDLPSSFDFKFLLSRSRYLLILWLESTWSFLLSRSRFILIILLAISKFNPDLTITCSCIWRIIYG